MLSKYRRKVQDSQSTFFFESVLLWVPTLPLHSQCTVTEPLALSVHAFFIPDFSANDNYSNMCLNGCTSLTETDEINILNTLFLQLTKHLIS